jgi:hypothetical protein
MYKSCIFYNFYAFTNIHCYQANPAPCVVFSGLLCRCVPRNDALYLTRAASPVPAALFPTHQEL